MNVKSVMKLFKMTAIMTATAYDWGQNPSNVPCSSKLVFDNCSVEKKSYV